METLIEETKFIMKKYNIRANKSLGQNFLISEQVVNEIVESSKIDKEDLVIEIGPGLGTLTMVEILQDRFKLYNNFELYQQDVLKIDLKHLIKKEKENTNIKKVKIVANLPYYITTPIIMKLLEEKLDLESITVMIQKEVADRLIAIPGEKETGAITYAVYYYAIAEAILEVPKESFIPEPEVTSKVIKLNIRKEPPIEVQDKELMFKIIKSAFMQRRKTLINALNNAKIFQNKEEGNQILESLKLDESVRAEKLTLENFADITNRILKKGI